MATKSDRKVALDENMSSAMSHSPFTKRTHQVIIYQHITYPKITCPAAMGTFHQRKFRSCSLITLPWLGHVKWRAGVPSHSGMLFQQVWWWHGWTLVFHPDIYSDTFIDCSLRDGCTMTFLNCHLITWSKYLPSIEWLVYRSPKNSIYRILFKPLLDNIRNC